MSKHLSSADSHAPQADVSPPINDGLIACDACGKVLTWRQKYRGRILCFGCADALRKLILGRGEKGKKRQQILSMEWDKENDPPW